MEILGVVASAQLMAAAEVPPEYELNFQTLTYTFGGEPIILSTVFGEDNSWGPFNPASIVEGQGIVADPDSYPSFLGALKSLILNSETTLGFDFFVPDE